MKRLYKVVAVLLNGDNLTREIICRGEDARMCHGVACKEMEELSKGWPEIHEIREGTMLVLYPASQIRVINATDEGEVAP